MAKLLKTFYLATFIKKFHTEDLHSQRTVQALGQWGWSKKWAHNKPLLVGHPIIFIISTDQKPKTVWRIVNINNGSQ